MSKTARPRLTRRRFLSASLLAAAGLVVRGCGGAGGPRRPARPPNFLLIIADDQRSDTIHALGNSLISTPNLDGLVQSGVAFTNACIMGATAQAVCIASRAMLLSGRSLFRAPPHLQRLVSLPELLRQAGYHTFATGKWHNGREAFARAFASGARIHFGHFASHQGLSVYDFDPTGLYPEGGSYPAPGFSSDVFSDAAAEFLSGYPGTTPFFAYLGYAAPHDPRTPPGTYAGMYSPASLPVAPNFLPEHPFDNGNLDVRDELLVPPPRTAAQVREETAKYYGMISHLDEGLGRVLEALRDSPHADNTVVIFTSDNGLSLGEHGLMGKQNLYQASLRVPLVMSGPGIPAGQTREALAYLMDLYPTVCELAGVPVPPRVEGSSLVPLLRSGTARARTSLYFAYLNCQRAVRDQQYKLIEYLVNGARTTQLFDLTADPWETTNLAARAAYADEIARLRSELLIWQRRVRDPLVLLP